MKKKYFSSLIGSLAVLLSATTMPVSAADEVSAVLSNTTFQTTQAEEFTTTVFVPENSNIASFEAVLNYDTSAVTFVKSTACEDNNGSVQVNEEDGKIYISYSAQENQTQKIDVVDLTFLVDDELSAGTYDFISLGESNASSETESGNATNHEITDNFTDMTIYQYGDADLNGKLQSRDVTYLKQYLVKLREIDEISKIYSNAYMDFEEDGTTPNINSRDAGIIQKKIVKMDVTLGDRANVTFYDRDGEVYASKSIKAGSELKNVPEFPELVGYKDYDWSMSADEFIEVDFSKIASDTEIYAWYGEPDANALKSLQVIEVLEEGFAEEGKYITDDFQLPYKSNFGSFNMLSTEEYSGLDIIWSIDSGVLAQSVNMSKDYVVDVPTGENQIPYTTWVDFTANIYFNGIKYDTQTFSREIQGKIDMPSPAQFIEIINTIPKELPEHYRLPGYVSLESQRKDYGVTTVQNVDISWSVVKNVNGFTADKRVLDIDNNEIIYLKDETDVTLQYDFIFDGNVIYSDRLTRTIPAKSIEGQIEYAQEYIKSFVPSIISGETYFPTSVPLYDLTVSWIPDIESGKVNIGENETVNGITYKVISVGEKAGYMEWAKVFANVERNGDESFKRTGIEFDVQLAGNSTEITTDKIPDVNLYNALLNIFDKKYGNDDSILTEEEIYNTEVMEKLGYELDLSDKDIRCLSGIKYLKYYRKLDLSNNDLSGENASLGELASLNYLEQLSLSNCGISNMPSSVFSSKFLIEGIDLSYNKLKDVNFLTLTDSRTQAEQPFTELKELFLQGNYISDISNLSFVNDSGELVSRIPNVNILTLSRDLNYYEYKIGEKLGKQVFKDVEEHEYDITTSMDIAPIGLMKNLTTLWLGNNYITDITPLANCKLLATLDLSGNSISATTSVDGLEPLSRLQSLICLKLDNNDIHTVKSLRRLIYLEILSLSNNHIGNTSGILDGLTNLTYLDLDKNELTSFDAGTFTKLQRLFLENQGYYLSEEENAEFISTLEQVLNLDQATGIVELRLNHNKIDASSVQSIANLKKLEYLSLSGNNVVDLDFLQELVYLTHLELANCNIRQAKEIITKDASTGETVTELIDNLSYLNDKKELVILDLSGNTELNDISSLSTLTKLGVFYMNNVELKSATAVRSMTKLQYLSMQNSKLTDFSFLSTLNQLEFLNLAGHSFDAFDFRNLKNYDNLVGLFLDSATNTEGININSFVNKQNLKYISISNIDIGTIDDLPDMDNIVYLGLRNTNISDFNGSYSETDGYIYPITRFNTLKYLDVAENPELFTKKNLEMLYDFVGKPEQKIAIILYRNDAPAGYVPGIMNPDIEAVKIKDDVDFGEGGTDILEAMNTGYSLQSNLNGYDIEWNIEENAHYYVDEGKLYFKNSDQIDENTKLSLTMNINELYYRETNENTKSYTPITFNASIQTSTKMVDTGEDKFVKRENTTSNEDSLEGWILDPNLTELGYSEWGDWSKWSTTEAIADDLREVETKEEATYSNWSSWSAWSKTVTTANDYCQVETKQEPYSNSVNVYYSACASKYTSIVDALKSINVDSTLANRKKIASLNGISGYTGTSSQNVKLLNLLKSGKLIQRVDTNTGYDTYYRYRTRTDMMVMYYRYRDRTKVPTVYHFYRDIYEDIYEEVISGMTLKVE